MTLEKYLELAPRTMAPGLTRRERIIYCSRYGIPGEFGEIVELLKKARFHGHELSQERLIEECGDLLWYAANLAIDTGSADKFIALDRGIRISTSFMGCENAEESENLAFASAAFSTCAEYAGVDSPEKLYQALVGAMRGVARLIAFLIATNKLPGTPEGVLDIITDANIEKLTDRYPEGFSEERSRKRDR